MTEKPKIIYLMSKLRLKHVINWKIKYWKNHHT